MKPIVFLADSRDRLRSFPDGPRRQCGQQLWRIQQGGEPVDWKPMPSVGLGVREIRVRDETGAYRVIYVAAYREAVYVLHAFEKKSRKTGKRDIELASARLRSMTRRAP